MIRSRDQFNFDVCQTLFFCISKIYNAQYAILHSVWCCCVIFTNDTFVKHYFVFLPFRFCYNVCWIIISAYYIVQNGDMFFFLSCSNVLHGIIVDVQCIFIVQINTFNYTFCWINFCSGLASLPSRYNNVESTVNIGCYVEQPKVNVVSTLQFLR